MKKKAIKSLCMAVMMLIGICTSACAFEEEDYSSTSASEAENEVISTAVIREADYLNDLFTASEEELEAMGISEEVIPKIISGEYEKDIRDELEYRATLPVEVLKNSYYYSEDQIETLKSFSGEESVYEMLVALDTKVTCQVSKVLYRYYTSLDITHLVLATEWEWNSQPTFTGDEDGEIVAFGWNNDYSLGMEQLRSWNYHYIHYTNGNQSVSVVENESNNASHTFPLNISGGWAQSGSAVISLQAAGLKSNSKFSMKYGHSETYLGEPSISIPAGISFSIVNVTTTFTPSAGIYNALRPDEYTSPIPPTRDSMPEMAFLNEVQ